MDSYAIRKAVLWGVAAFILTVIHPFSVRNGLIITIVASFIGALG
jgi:hypothetical protein